MGAGRRYDEHARYLFGPRALWRTRLDDGVRAPLVTPAQAQAHSFTAAQRERIAQQMQPNLVGTPQDVMARLHQLADRVQADESALPAGPMHRKTGYGHLNCWRRRMDCKSGRRCLTGFHQFACRDRMQPQIALFQSGNN